MPWSGMLDLFRGPDHPSLEAVTYVPCRILRCAGLLSVSGLGASFLVEPASGTLPPWGVVEISVTAFNDTPGRYTDNLECLFAGT